MDDEDVACRNDGDDAGQGNGESERDEWLEKSERHGHFRTLQLEDAGENGVVDRNGELG